jgi:hypothetical protein
MIPIRPVSGRFAVLSAGDAAVISPENALRYEPYVQLLAATSTEDLLDLYVRYYPLFQEAYEAQGFSNVYFNDRLVAVLDHLLATPQPRELLEVTQNEAVYEYVDESLESLSAGQKALLRLNGEQSTLVRGRLREFRAALAGSGLDKIETDDSAQTSAGNN